MDLRDQLQHLFPDHKEVEEKNNTKKSHNLWIQDTPLICKYEKRKGKPITIIEDYTGADSDFKTLTSILKKEFSVGGSFKKETIIIQGDYRDKIMVYLNDLGFKVKRVGG
jgi:translation initiation factor 1